MNAYGVEPLKEVLNSFFIAFPDLAFAIEDQIGEGGKVVTRWSAKGTHQGPWRGFFPKGKDIPPTSRSVIFGATDIYVIDDGKIVEEWNTLEQMAVLEQIGAVAPPE